MSFDPMPRVNEEARAISAEARNLIAAALAAGMAKVIPAGVSGAPYDCMASKSWKDRRDESRSIHRRAQKHAAARKKREAQQ